MTRWTLEIDHPGHAYVTDNGCTAELRGASVTFHHASPDREVAEAMHLAASAMHLAPAIAPARWGTIVTLHDDAAEAFVSAYFDL